MSVKISITCKSCGYVYDVFSIHSPKQFDCPSCFALISEEMSNMIKQAYLSVKGVNQIFREKYNADHEPLFVVSVQGIDTPEQIWKRQGTEE